jgi:hypothetical protein
MLQQILYKQSKVITESQVGNQKQPKWQKH